MLCLTVPVMKSFAVGSEIKRKRFLFSIPLATPVFVCSQLSSESSCPSANRCTIKLINQLQRTAELPTPMPMRLSMTTIQRPNPVGLGTPSSPRNHTKRLKSETRITASVLKQDPNAYNFQNNAIY